MHKPGRRSRNFLRTIFFILTMPLLFSLSCRSANTGYAESDFTAHYRSGDFTLSNPYTGMWQDARSGTYRRNIYVWKTSEVPEEMCELVVSGLEKIIGETGRTVTVMEPDAAIPDGYMPADWYQEETLTDQSRMHGAQSDAGRIIDLLRSHDRTNDHFVLLITYADLTTGEEGNNFIYGLSSYPYIVLSARRFIDWKRLREFGFEEEVYDQALTIVAAHEFGHYLDLTRRNFNIWSNTGTLLDNHCKGENGDCLMQQTNVNAEGCHTALEQAVLMYEREHWLCPDCAAEIYFRRQAVENEGYVW